jgi:uncharacterized protein with GYD domain
MYRYLTLINFTDQGIRSVKESPKRAAEFRAAVEAAGGKVIGQYWAVGKIDGALIFETADEATAAKLLLDLGKQGNVRTHTSRLYDAGEFAKLAGGV